MPKTEKSLIEKVQIQVQQSMSAGNAGHAFDHIERVWKLARAIGQSEGANMTVVEIAALLHDIADHKFHGGDLSVGPKVAAETLASLGAEKPLIKQVSTIISEVSFKGANVPDAPTSLEAKVVQDADRLDAIGAIGVARAFAYGGSKGRALYDPAEKPLKHQSFETYSKSESSTIAHFYEKLLLLKDRLHTKAAKRIARTRHQFLETFLKTFLREWNAEDTDCIDMAGRYYIYMIEMQNGHFYTGYTNNLERRFSEHKKGSAKLTRAFGVERMAGSWEMMESQGTAMKIEKFVKKLTRKDKEMILSKPKQLKRLLDEAWGLDMQIKPFRMVD